MFDFLKNIFHGKAGDATSVSESVRGVETTAAYASQAAPVSAPEAYAPRPAMNGNGDGVEVSLQAVLAAFPLDLKGRIRQSDVGEATVSIPLDKVLSQLAAGSVRITFGELRRAAPQLFAPGNECDQVQVPLPLNEILLQVDPTLLPRRTNQKRIEIPEEIRSPFGDIGNSLIFSVGPNKAEAPAAPSRATTPAAPARSEMPAPPPRSVTPAAAPRPEAAPAQARIVTPIPPARPEPSVPPIQPVAPPAPVKADAPVRSFVPPAPPVQPRPAAQPVVQPARPPVTPVATPPPAPAPFRTPLSPPTPPQPVPVAKTVAPPPAATPTPIRVPTSVPATPITPIAATAPPITPIAPGAPVMPVAPPAPRAPIAPAPVARPAAPASEVPSLSLPLMSLVEAWPESLRYELVQMNLLDAQLVLPVEAVEQSLKRGRIAFPWKALRACLRPHPVQAVSAHDNAVVELPLKVVAPLFLNRQKEAGKAQQKVAVDENIPNLFFGSQQAGQPGAGDTAMRSASPSSDTAMRRAPTSSDTAMRRASASSDTAMRRATPVAPPTAAKSSDTNYFSLEDAVNGAGATETQFQRKAAAAMPGTNFVTRSATPNEVVSRAAALDGVAGALIALPDGLMVASRLSTDLNGDTLAAFLPQIFSKVSQCTKELRMGELNNLNFTVGNVPWKIFRVNAIFFAAFGRPGQPLPTAQLVSLAAELDRKKQ